MFIFGAVGEHLAPHRHLQPLARGATLCTSFSTSPVLLCQRYRHQGGCWSRNSSSSLPSVCLTSSTQMKLEGKIRRLLGDEFQEKVSLFSQHSLFHLTAHPPCACLHAALTVALVGVTSAAIYLSDQAHSFPIPRHTQIVHSYKLYQLLNMGICAM